MYKLSEIIERISTGNPFVPSSVKVVIRKPTDAMEVKRYLKDHRPAQEAFDSFTENALKTSGGTIAAGILSNPNNKRMAVRNGLVMGSVIGGVDAVRSYSKAKREGRELNKAIHSSLDMQKEAAIRLPPIGPKKKSDPIGAFGNAQDISKHNQENMPENERRALVAQDRVRLLALRAAGVWNGTSY